MMNNKRDGWFGASYLGLMTIGSGIINHCIDTGNCSRMWKMYAVVMFMSWLPLKCFGIDLAMPGWEGISFNTLLFMYMTGRMLRQSQWMANAKVMHIGLGFLVLMAANIGWAAVGGFAEPGGIIYSLLIGSRDNNSPLTISLAVFAFLLFKKLSFPQIFKK